MQKKLDSHQLRVGFTEYFRSLGHTIVPSSSLIPSNDPTLLFVNSGMVQFKDTFLGRETRPYRCAASVQRCVRAGGKHNDLQNVGYTARHHTFFEMLGNFSFGDYFKREAIEYAWRFLTDILELPADRLWVTVFRDDEESANIWEKNIQVEKNRIIPCTEKDNFWQMGDTGPCGPCTEIYYDHGPGISGSLPGGKGDTGDRYVEIWNLVFMQYERDLHGTLHAIQPCVDTGMGLERLAAVMQGVHDNYDIELFVQLLRELSGLVGCADTHNVAMRVIVDHIRSSAFLITDGVTPSNEGRGYVLRRIIRRAIRYGYKLGQNQPFFYRLVPKLVSLMGEDYSELAKASSLVEHVLKTEEIKFSQTLARGIKLLDQEIERLSTGVVPGQVIFHLYDTYGFPPDLVADIAEEKKLEMDYAGFHAAMNQQRDQSQRAHRFTGQHSQKIHVGGETHFTGHETLIGAGEVTALLHQNNPVTQLNSGDEGIVVLNQTPFYAESGGQVGDKGYLYFENGSFHVKDTQKHGKNHLHIGDMIHGTLRIKDTVTAQVDPERQDIMLNHSATHLLHEALRRVLGEHVMQKGSLVEAKRLRFDFSHPTAMTPAELTSVERLINQQIRANSLSEVRTMTPEEAKNQGALALFGERYGNIVRVLKMGDFSTEICGGTHVKHSGEIGLFKIVSESACASGIRRIEAVTGAEAILYIEQEEKQLQEVSQLFNSTTEDVVEKAKQLLAERSQLKKEIEKLNQTLMEGIISQLKQKVVEVSGIHVISTQLPSGDREALRYVVDRLKHLFPKMVVVLSTVVGDKVHCIAAVSKNCLPYFDAPALLQFVLDQVGGQGGGRPDLAQGGASATHSLFPALDSVITWVKKKVFEGER